MKYMIINEKAFENGQYKQFGVLVNVDKLPLHHQLRVKRVYDGLTQTQLAGILGISDAPALSRIEQGKRSISKNLMERVHKYLYQETYVDGQLQEGNEI